MSGPTGTVETLTWDQRLVCRIDERLNQPGYRDLCEHPRTRSLPDMLRRHGLLQVVVFLKSKAPDSASDAAEGDAVGASGKGDGQLLKLLAEVLEDDLSHTAKNRAGEARSLSVQDIATLAPAQYLYLNEAAIRAAAWIQRLAAARVDLAKAGLGSGEES